MGVMMDLRRVNTIPLPAVPSALRAFWLAVVEAARRPFGVAHRAVPCFLDAGLWQWPAAVEAVEAVEGTIAAVTAVMAVTQTGAVVRFRVKCQYR